MDMVSLFRKIEDSLSVKELAMVVTELGVDWKDIPGGKSDKIRGTILKFKKSNDLPRLVRKLSERKPEIDWSPWGGTCPAPVQLAPTKKRAADVAILALMQYAEGLNDGGTLAQLALRLMGLL